MPSEGKWTRPACWKKSKIGLFFPSQNIVTSMAIRFPVGTAQPNMFGMVTAFDVGKKSTSSNLTTTFFDIGDIRMIKNRLGTLTF